jgi:hypothetical protein
MGLATPGTIPGKDPGLPEAPTETIAGSAMLYAPVVAETLGLDFDLLPFLGAFRALLVNRNSPSRYLRLSALK